MGKVKKTLPKSEDLILNHNLLGNLDKATFGPQIIFVNMENMSSIVRFHVLRK